MVLAWGDAIGSRPRITREYELLHGKSPAAEEIAAKYGLEKIVVPEPGSVDDFQYKARGRLPDALKLAEFVTAAGSAGYTVDVRRTAVMHQILVSQGQDVCLRAYAVCDTGLEKAVSSADPAILKVTVTHPEDIDFHTDTVLAGLFNKLVTLYGMEKAAAPAAASTPHP